MYKTYRVEELENPSQYAWFRTFSNPCYGMNIKVDVSEVVRISKERGTSFLPIRSISSQRHSTPCPKCVCARLEAKSVCTM